MYGSIEVKMITRPVPHQLVPSSAPSTTSVLQVIGSLKYSPHYRVAVAARTPVSPLAPCGAFPVPSCTILGEGSTERSPGEFQGGMATTLTLTSLS